jgi:small subunit ribosomal protein S17e
MGRVRTKTVKKSAKVIIERYYPKLTLDFETNKRICDEIAIIASKRLRNKVGLQGGLQLAKKGYSREGWN